MIGLTSELFLLAEKIKTLRENNGITQSELAKKLGLSRSGVNAWEMGISTPSTHYIVELAKFFNVSTDYLLNVQAKSDGNPIENKLLQTFRQMTVEQQNIYLEQGMAFVKSNENAKKKVKSS